MKVRLLVCAPYQDSRVSLRTCARRSAERPGTACEPCAIGAAARRGTSLPQAWPDGRPVLFTEVRVHGDAGDTGGLPVRGRLKP